MFMFIFDRMRVDNVMEIQIIFMSILTYIILFNSCLTFRLKFINNIIITDLLAIYL